MKAILLIATFTFIGCSHVTKNSKRKTDLTYDIEVIQRPFPMVAVRMSFVGEESGKTKIRIPNGWAGQEGFYNGIKDLQVDNRGALLSRTKENHVFEITHRPSERLAISYYLVQDWQGEVADERYYRAIIDKGFFHIFGYNLFAYPSWNDEEVKNIDLSWSLPSGWNMANSHGAQTKSQNLTIQMKYLKHAIYLAGDFDIRKFVISGHPLYVALRGDWKFSVDKYFDLVKKIIINERTFWNDFNYPYYLITMIPTDEPCCSKGGTGLINSFSTFVSKDTDQLDGFKHLLAHELFHNWNGRKIGRQQPEELVYWFSEGFTNYYTRLLNLRAGIIDIKEYYSDFNETLKRYFMSPARNESNKVVLKKFWTDRSIEKLPYQRGDILAHNWNTKIKKANDKFSIDLMMKDLLKAAKNEGTVVSAKNIDSLIRPYLKSGILRDVKNNIEKGKTIKIQQDALGSCGKLTWRNGHKFDMGFDYPRSKKEGRVIGTKKNSPAYYAGLRDGQEIIGRSVHGGDTSKKSSITIKQKSGETKEISFYPKGDVVRFPQFVLDNRLLNKNSSKCLTWFQ